jgi:hypothetical protein
LRIADHRRSMQALRRAAAKAATEAAVTAAARPPADRTADRDADGAGDNVRSLAAARARRGEHPAGSAHAQ